MRWPVALGLGRSSKFQCVLLGLLVATPYAPRPPTTFRGTCVADSNSEHSSTVNNTTKLSNGTCRLGRRETPYRAIDGTLRGQFVLLFKIQRMVPCYDIRIGGAFVHRSKWVKWLIRGHNSAHHRMSLRCTDSWGEGMPVLLS